MHVANAAAGPQMLCICGPAGMDSKCLIMFYIFRPAGTDSLFIPCGEDFLHFAFGLEDFIQGGIFNKAAGLHAVKDHLGNLREGDSALQELLHGIFVCCVKGCGNISAFPDRIEGVAKGRECLHVGTLEGDPAKGIEVKSFSRHGAALRIVEGILDRQAHVRDTQLGDDTAVLIFHRRVDDALGVDQDLDLRGIDVEQPAGFDDFQALIDEGG